MNQTKTRIPGTPKIQANKYFMTLSLPPLQRAILLPRPRAAEAVCHEGFRFNPLAVDRVNFAQLGRIWNKLPDSDGVPFLPR